MTGTLHCVGGGIGPSLPRTRKDGAAASNGRASTAPSNVGWLDTDSSGLWRMTGSRPGSWCRSRFPACGLRGAIHILGAVHGLATAGLDFPRKTGGLF